MDASLHMCSASIRSHIDLPPAENGNAEMAKKPVESKKLKSTSRDTITVEIGHETRRSFTVHRDLLAANSSFLKAAAAPGKWKEPSVIHLTECQAEDFQLYLESLYDRSTDLLMGLHVTHAALIYDEEEVSSKQISHLLAQGWMLGDYLGDGAYKNCIMRAIFDHEGELSRETINMIAYNTPPDSTIYRWLTDMIINNLQAETIDDCTNYWVPEIFPQLLKASLNRIAQAGGEAQTKDLTVDMYQEEVAQELTYVDIMEEPELQWLARAEKRKAWTLKGCSTLGEMDNESQE